MTVPTIYDLTDLVLAALRAVPQFAPTPQNPTGHVFDAEVPKTPPMDGAGVIKPYAVVYPSPGHLTASRYVDLADHLTWRCQVTCAAGSRRGASVAVDWTRDALTNLRLVDDPSVSLLREVGDPGPVTRDDSIANDIRWYSPLQFILDT